jgi:hypothetical protein
MVAPEICNALEPSDGLEPSTPPYHAIQTAAGGSQWQRLGARSSQFRAFGEPNVRHPLRPLCSITVPSQSAQKRAVLNVASSCKRKLDPFRIERGSLGGLRSTDGGADHRDERVPIYGAVRVAAGLIGGRGGVARGGVIVICRRARRVTFLSRTPGPPSGEVGSYRCVARGGSSSSVMRA